MSVRLRLAATLLAASVSLVFGGSVFAMSHPKLTGTTGPGFTIKLKNSGGHVVKTLKAGTYTFVIHDKSNFHSFALDGPHGFAKDFTKVPFVGTKTATLTLKKGKYKYYCANHESTMFGHFTVN
jgi:plastocyanin